MNLQQLETERKQLFANMDEAENFNDRSAWVKKLKENERKLNEVRTAQMLANVNREQARKRELARLVWECEQPTEDITTADGSLHKVKARKYPKIAALPYPRLKFKDGLTTEIKTNGETFRMFKSKYEYNKPTEYTRPATFEEFLEMNSIHPQEITSAEFAEFSQKLNEANEELEKAHRAYDAKRNALNVYMMQHIGLVRQSNTNTYKYEAKTGY